MHKLDGVLEKLCYVLPWCSSMGPLGEVRGWSPPVPRYLTRFNKGRKFSSFMAWISYKLKHFLFYFDQTSASPTPMTTPTSTTGWSPPLPRYLTHYNKEDSFSLTIRISCWFLSMTSAEKCVPNPSIFPVVSEKISFGNCFRATHASQELDTSSTILWKPGV